MEYYCLLKEALDVLRPTYKSIDLRAMLVAPGDEGGWWSVWTIIRLSSKSPAKVAEEHDNLRQQHNLRPELLSHSLAPEHNDGPFSGLNVELSAYPIDKLEHIVARLDQGFVNCESRTFRIDGLAEAITPGIFKRNVTWRPDPHATDSGDWPAYYCGICDKTAQLLGSSDAGRKWASVNEPDLTKWAREAEFSNFREMSDSLLDSFFQHGGNGNRFEIWAPIYARIDEVVHSGKLVLVKGRFHRRLGPMRLECLVNKFDRQGSITQPRSLGRLDVSSDTDGEDIVPFFREAPMDAPPELGRATAVLFKSGPPRVDLFESWVMLRQPLPFIKSFTSFVPEADVAEYLHSLVSGQGISECALFKRFTPKDGSKKIEEVLEHVVNYLLALCQLNPIPLSNPAYDVLSGGMKAGSADILAMTPEGDPVLVSCTMGMPADRKYGMLLSAATAIRQRFGWSEDRLKLLLITGKPSVPRSSATGPILTPKTTVRMLAAEDLKSLWEMIQGGDISGARSFLGLAAIGSEHPF